MEVTAIPFNRYLGITRREESGEAVLELRQSEDLCNHLNTMHACAMLALAEAASGECLYQRFRHIYESGSYIPVVRETSVKYHRPGTSLLRARASIRDEDEGKAIDMLTSKGRAWIPVNATLYDENNVLTMTATFVWFVQKISEQAETKGAHNQAL